MQSLLGVAFLLVLAIALSESRRHINWRIVGSAFALQAAVGGFVLFVPAGQTLLATLAAGVNQLVGYADEGTRFMFGALASDEMGFVVALRVLPVIVFVSSLVSVLYYLRLMPLLVTLLGGALRALLGVTRVEGLAAAANVFVGMVEAPLAVRPYLASLTRPQFFCVLAGGLSSVTGAMLLAYAGLGVEIQYLVAAAFMAAPGGILMAKLLVPDVPMDATGQAGVADANRGGADEPVAEVLGKPANVVEAAADGAAAGLKIALSVGAMLVAFIALLALANGLIGALGGWIGQPELSFDRILGWLFAPVAFLMGIPWSESVIAGNLIGQKTILNEFVAYVSFVGEKENLSAHAQAIMTFALCGFANLSALAILMGGMATLLPQRKSEVARLGLKAVLAGTLSNLMSASLAGLFLSI
ncbi:MAG: nucleoside transporter C-terminal domain-containing protein [Pseudomonadota bacterium]